MELFDTLQRVLQKKGFDSERASLSARLFTDATCDGVYSHGINRFPQYVEMIYNGSIDVHARGRTGREFRIVGTLGWKTRPWQSECLLRHEEGYHTRLRERNRLRCTG